MVTVRTLLFSAIFLLGQSLSGQINREWVKYDYAVIDSLAAMDKNNPAEVFRFFSKALEPEKKVLGFGWTYCKKQWGAGYVTYYVDFYFYKDTVKTYIISAHGPHQKKLEKEYQQLFSRALSVNKDYVYEYAYGKENLLRPLDEYRHVENALIIPAKMLRYMSPESGLEYGFVGRSAFLQNRSFFMAFKNKLTPDQVIAMMYSINPASRLTAIEYYLRNKGRFNTSNEIKDWIETVYREVPKITTRFGCRESEQDSKELVAQMVAMKQD